MKSNESYVRGFIYDEIAMDPSKTYRDVGESVDGLLGERCAVFRAIKKFLCRTRCNASRRKYDERKWIDEN